MLIKYLSPLSVWFALLLAYWGVNDIVVKSIIGIVMVIILVVITLSYLTRHHREDYETN